MVLIIIIIIIIIININQPMSVRIDGMTCSPLRVGPLAGPGPARLTPIPHTQIRLTPYPRGPILGDREKCRDHMMMTEWVALQL